MTHRTGSAATVNPASIAPTPPGASEGRGADQRSMHLVILANTQTPYRLHFHRRIVREMPEVRLWSLFTHEHDKQRWEWVEDASIGTRCFGWGESVAAPFSLQRRLRDWRKGRRVIQWLGRHQVDALLVLGYADVGKIRALRWAHARNIPTMMFLDSNVFGDNVRGLRRIVKRALLRRVLSWCDCLLPCGSAGEAYLRRYGVPDDRMIRCPYEPDYRMIQTLQGEQMKRARERFRLCADRRRIMYCGRLSTEKRVDLLLEAFGRISTQRPEWDLVLVGDGPLRDRLDAAPNPEIRDRTIWTGFISDAREVAALMRCCDVLAVPSDYEPWGLVVNEALAAGMAVIASDVVGAARELVRPGVNGALFPPGDVEALVRAMLDTTSPSEIDVRKAASSDVLAQWRQQSDPIDGLQRALAHIGAWPVAPTAQRS